MDADYIIQTDDRISVYPVFERFNIKNVTQVRSQPLRRPKFITDAGLEELADQMNTLGLDVVCHASGTQSALIHRADIEKRIILTLDRKILKKRSVIRAIALNTRKTEFQVKEIRRYLYL